MNFTDDGELIVSPTAEDITESFRGECCVHNLDYAPHGPSYRPTRDRTQVKRGRQKRGRGIENRNTPAALVPDHKKTLCIQPFQVF